MVAHHLWCVHLAGGHDASTHSVHHPGSVTRAQGVKVLLKDLCISAVEAISCRL